MDKMKEKECNMLFMLGYVPYLLGRLILRLVLLPSAKLLWKIYLLIAVTMCTLYIIKFTLLALHLFFGFKLQ